MKLAEITNMAERLGGLEPVGGGVQFVPVSEEELQSLERQIGTSFPEPYRQFVGTYGASRFGHSVGFSITSPPSGTAGAPRRGVLSGFYGAMNSLNNTLSLAWAIKTFRDRMPESVVPIGAEGGGDQLVLGVAADERGRIYYWDHENEWDEEDFIEDGLPVPPNLKFQNLHHIADSFEEFLRNLEVLDCGD